jgi:D-3-phosphoglycerate dehydrogenase
VVDLDELKKALEKNEMGGAAIDVFPKEPAKNGDPFSTPLQGLSNVILTPHIGGSTEEAQQNIGEDVSNKLFNFLEKGITTGSHSVPPLNLPPHENSHRILHIHKNVPGVLSEINTQLSSHKINILSQYLKTNDDIGYVVLDVNKSLSKEAVIRNYFGSGKNLFSNEKSFSVCRMEQPRNGELRRTERNLITLPAF